MLLASFTFRSGSGVQPTSPQAPQSLGSLQGSLYNWVSQREPGFSVAPGVSKKLGFSRERESERESLVSVLHLGSAETELEFSRERMRESMGSSE